MAGKASEIINIYETDTWPKLKSVLQKNLVDNRNEITLSLDLQRLSQALQVFVTSLNEPYGSMLRAKDPSTLVDAIRFLEREELVRYRQLPKNDELNKALDRIIQDTQNDDNLLMQVNLDQDDEQVNLDQDDEHVIRKLQQNQNANETLDEITQHTQEENISSSIEITEKSLNHFKNQIIFQDMRCGTPYCKLSKTEKNLTIQKNIFY
ncbi:hypothetical protein ILUMI_16130 [Ignelater luminosus]|uniref:Uncharacterized protein n=1 Tax=Ignelater luminosus TaxID=2038154 RepID=A0A8K0CSU7_IGNLU|nr:hypothetical protein ILUMI_16130 [Ignelater luminosus]